MFDHFLSLPHTHIYTTLSWCLREWTTCEVWSEKLVAEQVAQGQLEEKEGLPSALCNKQRSEKSAIFVSFLDHIASPMLTKLSVLLPQLKDYTSANLTANRDAWEQKVLAHVQKTIKNPDKRVRALEVIASRYEGACFILLP
jgi:hypothetical protein